LKQIHKLYDGSVELMFDDSNHSYWVNGERVIGVTTPLGVINKPALMGWALKLAGEAIISSITAGKTYDEIEIRNIAETAKKAHVGASQNAKDIGTLCHQWLEDYIAGKNPPDPVHPAINAVSKQFLKWEKENPTLEILESERPIYSLKHNYAGTMDFIFKLDGKVYLGDFKTSTGIWDENWYQVAAYRMAFQEENPDFKIDGQMIFRFDKENVDGIEVAISQPDDYKKDKEAFLSALQIYKRQKERNKKWN